MSLNPQDLEKITDLTLDHYKARGEDFWEGTRDHNVNQNIVALLQCIKGEPPFTILDFGCGPGRDLKVFAELDHIAVGLDGAAQFAVMACAHISCEVWQDIRRRPDMRTKCPLIGRPSAVRSVPITIDPGQ